MQIIYVLDILRNTSFNLNYFYLLIGLCVLLNFLVIMRILLWVTLKLVRYNEVN